MGFLVKEYYAINAFSGAIVADAQRLVDCFGFGKVDGGQILSQVIKFLNQSDDFNFERNLIFNYQVPGTFTIGKAEPKGYMCTFGFKPVTWEVRLQLDFAPSSITPYVKVLEINYDRLFCALVGWTDVSIMHAHTMNAIPAWKFYAPFYAHNVINERGQDLSNSICPCGSGLNVKTCDCVNFDRPKS